MKHAQWTGCAGTDHWNISATHWDILSFAWAPPDMLLAGLGRFAFKLQTPSASTTKFGRLCEDRLCPISRTFNCFAADIASASIRGYVHHRAVFTPLRPDRILDGGRA